MYLVCVCVCLSPPEEVMMMDGGAERDWGSCAQWGLVWWYLGWVPFIFSHISILWYNTKSMAWLAFMLWQKTFIHCVDKDPFVQEILGVLCECVCSSLSFTSSFFSFFFTSVLSHVPFVACRQTAVLLWFHLQMSESAMGLCPHLHLSVPAVRQFTSAYYPSQAQGDPTIMWFLIRALTVSFSLWWHTPQMTTSLRIETGGCPPISGVICYGVVMSGVTN